MLDNRIGVTYTGDETRTADQSTTAARAGSTGEAFLGAAAVVLGILGLIGLASTVLDAIAAIVIGVGLLMAGRFVMSHSATVNAETRETKQSWQAVKSSSSMATLAGVAGIVLGILALIGIASASLIAISAIVLGAGLIMAGGARTGVEKMHTVSATGEQHTVRDVIYAASGSDVIIGAGAIVLGILALIGLAPLTLTLIAMLAMGAALMLSGSTFASRTFHHVG